MAYTRNTEGCAVSVCVTVVCDCHARLWLSCVPIFNTRGSIPFRNAAGRMATQTTIYPRYRRSVHLYCTYLLPVLHPARSWKRAHHGITRHVWSTGTPCQALPVPPYPYVPKPTLIGAGGLLAHPELHLESLMSVFRAIISALFLPR